MATGSSVPLIIGHRGASAHAPENTLASFQRAIDDGAEGIEFDVRLARDGVPVVIHDETLARTAGVNSLVSALTSAELAEIDVGSWFTARPRGTAPTPEFGGERVRSLADTLERLGHFTGLLFVELKCGGDDLEPLTDAVCEIVGSTPLLPQIILKSFRLAVLPRVRVRAPGVRTAALFAPKIMTILRKEKHLVRIAREFGADELSVHYSLATAKLMDKAGEHNFPVSIWTADNPRWVKRGARLGLRSIITNDPARLLARREELSGSRLSG